MAQLSRWQVCQAGRCFSLRSLHTKLEGDEADNDEEGQCL